MGALFSEVFIAIRVVYFVLKIFVKIFCFKIEKMCNELFLGGFYFLTIFLVNVLFLILVKKILDNFKQSRKIKKILTTCIGEEKYIPRLFYFLEKNKTKNIKKKFKNFEFFFSRENEDQIIILKLISFLSLKKSFNQNYYFELLKKEFNL